MAEKIDSSATSKNSDASGEEPGLSFLKPIDPGDDFLNKFSSVTQEIVAYIIICLFFLLLNFYVLFYVGSKKVYKDKIFTFIFLTISIICVTFVCCKTRLVSGENFLVSYFIFLVCCSLWIYTYSLSFLDNETGVDRSYNDYIYPLAMLLSTTYIIYMLSRYNHWILMIVPSILSLYFLYLKM